MAKVNVHEAKTNLSRLLMRVEAGEEVVIARNGEPVARLVRVQKRSKRQFGSWKGRVKLDDAIFDDSFFFDPLPEEELAAWEGKA
ncbi:MAG: type II toxin-antitoxin system prevent-host-death family antitoxin [Nitrospira sp.]|nr:type II toxin-antitoxin system prevent-host-death family antitoxin [Nitrospira sp.]